MTDPNHSTDDSGIDYGLDRRRVIQALGAGVGLSAFSGIASAHGDEDESDGRIPVDRLQDGNALVSDHEVHPVYGFSSQVAKVAPPVEPDHEVQALISQGEGGAGFFFEPTGLYVEPGDTVKFTMATPHHNVVAYHPQFGYQRRIPRLVPPFSGPLLPQGGYWLYTFEKPGVYEMNCAPHEIFGMAMRIVVGEVSGPAADPLPDLCAQPPGGGEGGGEGGESEGPSLRPPGLTAYTVLSDPAMAPDRIVERGSVSWEEIDPQNRQVFVQVEGFPPCGPSGGAEG
ncbi:cupredoxin domain-containing protein [Halococcus agarilyticus]|uniref:cupredoxin domain-containing protein n=1 Tax=Halococcus agarilyticus TaxID=1232219 RepID=UPI0006778DB1|nr:plastocyanin/azurin family copper-binding protein [Halococcus agarilyticus]